MTVMLDSTTYEKLLLGTKTEKTAAHLADIDLFKVYGKVLCTLLIGEVTGVGDGGATTIALNEKTDSLAIAAATTVTSDAVGTMYGVTGDTTLILCGTANTPILKLSQFLSAFPHQPMIFNGGTSGITIEATQTGADATLTVLWSLFWIALEDGAYVEAA